MKYKPDANSTRIGKWLEKSVKNARQLSAFIEEKGHSSHGIAHALFGHEFGGLRKEIVKKFKIKQEKL